jgi:hypothetical protein
MELYLVQLGEAKPEPKDHERLDLRCGSVSSSIEM